MKSSFSRVLPLVEFGVSSVTAEGQIESGDSLPGDAHGLVLVARYLGSRE